MKTELKNIKIDAEKHQSVRKMAANHNCQISVVTTAIWQVAMKHRDELEDTIRLLAEAAERMA